jgi:hypothetical protein
MAENPQDAARWNGDAASARRRGSRLQRSTIGGSTSVHDITIPPTGSKQRLDPVAASSAAWLDERTDTAVFHGLATTMLTAMLVAWTVGRGEVPALDPHAGVLLLVLQLGACVTGWLALEAARDVRREIDAGTVPGPVPARIPALGLTAVVSLLVNTAMAIAALLP